MASNKEIEITLSLKDEASKKIQSFRSSVKEFSTATKSNLAPVLQLRQAWMKTSLAVGVVTGAIALGIKQVNILNSEIEGLDKSSAKLGVSTSELSKKIYGFNVATDESRIGLAWYKGGLTGIGNAVMYVRKTLAEMPAAAAINAEMGRMEEELIRKATQAKRQQNPFIASALSDSEMGQIRSQASKENAIKNLLESAQKQKEVEAIKNGTVAEAVAKRNQLEMSGYAFKLQLLKEETAAYKAAGVDKVTIANYEVAARKRLEEDYTIEAKNQQAVVLEAEGNTLEALRVKQENALAAYKRQWGSDGEAVNSFVAGQQAVRKQAELTYLGVKNNAQIMHDAWSSYVGSMTNTFSDVFYGVITGEIDSLGDTFANFGKQILKILSDMLAQYMAAQAVLGIRNLLQGSTITGGVGGSTTQTAQFGTVWSPTAMAEGGAGIVTKPTLFLAGEAGPERYAFNPLNKTSGENSSNGQQYVQCDVNIYAMDQQSFVEYCKRNPEGIIAVAKSVTQRDLRTRGDLHKFVVKNN